jgi:protein-disulfide isomerase
MTRFARKHLRKPVGRKLVGAAAAAGALAPGLALGLALALSLSITGAATAQEQSRPGGFAPEQVDGIEQIVRDYLLAHPEILIQSLNEFQQRQEVAAKQRQQQSVLASRAALTQDPDSPVLGNPDGDVAIVEFFDYKCPYCKRVSGTLKDVVAADGKIRLIMKEFPILGPRSIQAARAALAVAKQGKYGEFHWALMTEPGDMSDPHIRQIARSVGVDVDRMMVDMESPEIQAMIKRNQVLAQALQITGTPAFVIGNTLVPGAIDRKALERLVAQTRAEQS